MEDAAKIETEIGTLCGVEDILGRTFSSVVQSSLDGEDRILFEAPTGERWHMVYHQDCCAKCNIEDVAGDLQDLVGAPIILAEESTNQDEPRASERGESFTWTFYKFATAKGYVTVRWYGSSNGYYSESATFERAS